MNVLMLTSSFPRYEGDFLGPWVLEYARELKRQGHFVVVVAPVSGKMDLDYLSEENLLIRRFNYFYPRTAQTLVSPPGMMPNLKKKKWLIIHVPFLLCQFYRVAAQVIKEYNIDIIHSQWAIPAGFVGTLLKKKTKRPHVITSQGAEFFLSQSHPFSFFTSYTLKHCDQLLPVSQQMGKRAIKYGMPAEKITVVPNTVNPAIFHPATPTNFRQDYSIPKTAKVILTIRRLVYEKRVEDVIDAFAQVVNDDTFLVIGGDGPERDKLEARVKRLNIQKQVIFLGYVANKDLPPIYAAADSYILSSQQEGLSLSLLESMSSGLITVSTAGTGGSEVIRSGENGFLYSVGEVVELVNILRQFLHMTPLQRTRMEQQARQTVLDKFSVSGMVRAWQTIYQKLL